MEYKTCYFLDDEKRRDFGDYYWFAEAFSDEELKKIETQIEKANINVDYGKIFSSTDLEEVKDYRNSKIGWIPQDSEFAWLYEKISAYSREANEAIWHFDLVGMQEQAQYGVYEGSETGHYDWHIDLGSEGLPARRKISVCIQLSDPEDYEGGDLQIKVKRDETNVWRQKGGVACFPSFYLHKVTPVTKGIRKSLVLWNSGPPWR